MIKHIKRILKGCGYLEGYGTHPGTEWIMLFIFVGFMVGISDGTFYGFLGAGLFALFFGPIYLYGAWSRGKCFEKDQEVTQGTTNLK